MQKRLTLIKLQIAKENIKDIIKIGHKFLIIKILIIGGSGYGKTIGLFNLMIRQPDVRKIYLFAKDPYKAKYRLLINNCKGVGLQEYNDYKAFIEYSTDVDDMKILKNSIQIRNAKY